MSDETQLPRESDNRALAAELREWAEQVVPDQEGTCDLLLRAAAALDPVPTAERSITGEHERLARWGEGA